MRKEMKIVNVTSAKKNPDNSIELTIVNPLEGGKEINKYAAIRGGISWPTTKAPAYFCIVGQEYTESQGKEDSVSPGTRILLAEYVSDSLSLSGFYNRIIDLSEQMLCRGFYLFIEDIRYDDGNLHDLQKADQMRGGNISLRDAYDKNNFLLGISRIRESIDKGELIIPEDSIVYSQLQNITREDLENKPENIFSAINALRHVLGSFYRDPPRNHYHTSRRPPPDWRCV